MIDVKKSSLLSYLYIFAGLLVLCVFFSCTQDRQPCLTPKTASLNVVCVHYPTDSATSTQDTALPKAIWGAITNSGTRAIYYSSPSAYYTLSLSPDTDSCQWLVSTDSFSTEIDTLSFTYQRKLQFLSNACGFTYFYSLNTVRATHHNIDSALITNPSVTNDANTTRQLKLYIHPAF